MQNRVTYEYAIIRLVPKVEREEFLNIGVILYSKIKKYLGIRFQIDPQRITAFSKEVDTNLIEKYLSAWELICAGAPASGRIGQLELASRFRWLAANRSTIIQTSKIHPGLCENPESVLENLFMRYIL